MMLVVIMMVMMVVLVVLTKLGRSKPLLLLQLPLLLNTQVSGVV